MDESNRTQRVTTQGDGTRDVTLSGVSGAALSEVMHCRGELRSIQRRLGRAENPDGGGPEQQMMEETGAKARDVARHVAAHLEACAGALRNASDLSGPLFE